MQYDEAEIIETTRQLILNEILRSNIALDADALLIQSGYLTSLQAVELVELLSSTYGIEIEPEDVNEDEFNSLRTIAALVVRKLPS
jgi:acyl carrier protein